MIQNFRKGFSLVELLVVIAIIGILAAVGITAYSGYTNSAKAKATMANHAAVLALINSELAKCSTGAGNFVWGSPDACNAGPVEAAIVAHFGIGGLGLMNPYNRNIAQVTLAETGMIANWDGTDADEIQILGATSVHCAGGQGTSCIVASNPGEGGVLLANDIRVVLQTY